MVKGINKAGKPVALVLGGIVNHIILIEKLQKRGFYVILVDYLDDPPAKAVADEHVQISTFDEAAIEKLAIERNASLIINANLEQVNVIAIRVSERIGLPVPYSSEVALNVSNKQRMKQIMIEEGIPTAPFVCTLDVHDDELNSLAFPVFVKPADGSGSKGVYRVERPSDFVQLFERSREFSRNGKVIVEEEEAGREYNAYFFISDKKAYLLNVAERYFGIGNGITLTQCYGTFAPAKLSACVYAKLSKIADKIVAAFNLLTCPMFMQVKIDEQGEIQVIEFACRMAGGISHQVIRARTGFDWFEGTIDAFLGNSVDVELSKKSNDIFIVSSLLARPGIYGEMLGYQELIDEGIIEKISLARRRGAVLDDTKANGEKVGFFMVRGTTEEDVLMKVDQCFDRLSLKDIDGKELLRKDAHITATFLERDTER